MKFQSSLSQAQFELLRPLLEAKSRLSPDTIPIIESVMVKGEAVTVVAELHQLTRQAVYERLRSARKLFKAHFLPDLDRESVAAPLHNEDLPQEVVIRVLTEKVRQLERENAELRAHGQCACGSKFKVR